MDDRAPTLAEILQDRSFCTLLRLSQREAMTWDTFLQHPLPPNMSPLSVWETLGAIGRCIGVHLFPSADGKLLWYRKTSELSDLVKTIERRSAENSPLCEALLDHADRSFILGSRLAEANASAQLGGIAVDRVRLETNVGPNAPPARPAERIVASAVTIDADLAIYAKQPFSRELLSDFYHRLTEGIDPEDLADTRLAGSDADDERSLPAIQTQLDRIVDYANAREDSEDPWVLRGSLIADAIRYYEPFGPASSHIASLASRLFYLKHGLPVLAIVPVTAAKLSLIEGGLSTPVLCDQAEYEGTRRRSCCDLTVRHTLSAQCIEATLGGVEARIMCIESRDVAAKTLLSADPRFNHRQRSILARALRAPHAEFHIRYHQEKHRISYATARRDLVELADAGYLRTEHRGKAFVFVATGGIEELSRSLA